jgi:mono/diheme cytochrome c family protein
MSKIILNLIENVRQAASLSRGDRRKATTIRQIAGQMPALTAALITLLLFAGAASAQSAGAQLFEKSCYSCHNIGSGDKKGPDLKGALTRQSREWLREFIQSPNAMNRKGDANAQQLFKKWAPEVMPDQVLSTDQIDQILALIDELTKKNEAFVPAGAKLARAIDPADIDAGREIFTGRRSLAGGGASCNSCHSVMGVGRLGGGTLGPDLTAVNTKYKDPELISILQNPNFPTMKSVFAARPLNDEEIVQVFAYLQNAKTAFPAAQSNPGAISIEPWFVAIGFAATLGALVALNFIWRKRLRGVREELVRRSRQ